MQKFSTVIGILIAFALILSGIGFSNLGNFIDPPSILIVVGGTIGTTLMIYGLDGLKSAISLIKVALTRNDMDRVSELIRVLKMAKKGRKEGLLSLESDCAETEDEFIKGGLQLVIDGNSPDLTRDILNKEIENTEKRHTASNDILKFIALTSPAFGMVGTLIGLVGMLQNLSDPDMIGPQMAVALLTTFYGSVIANVIFIPLSKKLEKIADTEITIKEAILEGLLSLQADESPTTTELKLKAYLSPATKQLFEEELQK